jgi:kynureninase
VSHTLAHWRRDYPILARSTYLASHSLGAVPQAAKDALAQYHHEWATLGILAWNGPWWQAVLDFQADIEAILGAESGTVVPMQNVTRGMAAIASALDYSKGRNKVILTDLEFTTSYPFWQAQCDYGAEIVVIPSLDGMTVPTQSIIDAIDEQTLILPLSHVYFRSGAIQDIGAICEAAHQKGAWVMADGYQAVGTIEVNVQALKVDFYLGGSHKWLCGGPGAAFLYVRPELVSRLKPRLTGWFGVQNPFGYERGTTRPQLNDGVHRFLCGTPNIPALYAARVGIGNIREIGMADIRSVGRQLSEYAREQALARGLSIKSPADSGRCSNMLCIDFEGAQAAAAALEEQHIIVDWRPDCGIRLSPHFYNLQEDLDTLFGALDAI